MAQYPADEPAEFMTGDVIYRQCTTMLFAAWDDVPSEGMIQEVVLDGEPLQVMVIALITGGSFRVVYSLDHTSIDAVLNENRRLLKETVARRLFPYLLDYRFRTEDTDADSQGRYVA